MGLSFFEVWDQFFGLSGPGYAGLASRAPVCFAQLSFLFSGVMRTSVVTQSKIPWTRGRASPTVLLTNILGYLDPTLEACSAEVDADCRLLAAALHANQDRVCWRHPRIRQNQKGTRDAS